MAARILGASMQPRSCHKFLGWMNSGIGLIDSQKRICMAPAKPGIHAGTNRKQIKRRLQLSVQSSFFDQAWGTSVDLQTLNQTLAPNLFAFSIFPYAGFLYHLTKSQKAPPLTLFGFYFLLAFVFVTIPAGIYAKNVYGTTLANVDFLHGPAEFLLTLTNLFIVLGLRNGIREAEAEKAKEKEFLEERVE